MRLRLLAIALLLALAPDVTSAQSRTRVWDIALGTPVEKLPQAEFVDPACGTNGGPPSLPLGSFADFRRCPVESATGLREVWFIYDDEWEYIARAQRDPLEITRFSANSMFRQPIITSLMIDDAGLVQGFRVVTDPRAPIAVRMQAYLLFPILKGIVAAAPWECVDLPRDERERPFDIGTILKASCVMVGERRFARAEGRHLLKPGQEVGAIPRLLEQAEGEFESSARLEVYSRAAVSGASCCPTAARR
ncbi:MAG: hypothetical protein FJX64_06485 [Alphaproteobacteria bacterium]|nr:hypothetical protein [Alphaproteobacteria bacterium]MBM4437813.1 hypothetical protein [Actinomycetota bacterium]